MSASSRTWPLLRFATGVVCLLAMAMCLRAPACTALEAKPVFIADGRRPATPEDLRRVCEYGVMLALQGDLASAEKAFTSLLTDSRGDARALTNLGNLRLLQGDRATALEFYDRAMLADTADAGIQLNRAMMLYLQQDDSLAYAAAAQAVARAGGPANAQALLGLDSRHDDSDKAADMGALLRFPIKPVGAATGRDTSDAEAGRPPARAGRTTVMRRELRSLVASKPVAPSRTSSTRSSENDAGGPGSARASSSAAATVLYWKY